MIVSNFIFRHKTYILKLMGTYTRNLFFHLFQNQIFHVFLPLGFDGKHLLSVNDEFDLIVLIDLKVEIGLR